MTIRARTGTLRRSAMIASALLAACGSDDGPNNDPPGTKVEFSYCVDKPMWVAVQDGDRPWTRVLPVAEGEYEATFRSTRGGVATVGAGGGSLQVNYGTLAELATIMCDDGYKFVTGTVTGVPYPQRASISLGGLTSAAIRDTFRLWNVAEGPQDLFAARQTVDQVGGAADRVIIRRDMDPPSYSSLAPVNFDSLEAFAPAVGTFSLNNLGDVPYASVYSTWHGRDAARGTLGWTGLDGLASSGGYVAVPLDKLGAGDLSSLDVYIYDPPASDRYASVYFRAPQDMTVSMGPVVSTPIVTFPTVDATVRPRVQLSSQAEYGRLVHVTYYQEYDQVSVAVTSAYLGATPATWDVAVPDLSSAEGWNDAWGFASAEGISWFVSAEGGADRLLGDLVREGDVFRSANNSGGGTEAASTKALVSRREPHRGGFPRLPPRPAP